MIRYQNPHIAVNKRLDTVTAVIYSGSNRLGTMKIGSSQKGSSSHPGGSFYIYKLNSRASAVRVIVLLFSFSIFSNCRSLKIENENNSIKHKCRNLTTEFSHMDHRVLRTSSSQAGFEPLKFYTKPDDYCFISL